MISHVLFFILITLPLIAFGWSIVAMITWSQSPILEIGILVCFCSGTMFACVLKRYHLFVEHERNHTELPVNEDDEVVHRNATVSLLDGAIVLLCICTIVATSFSIKYVAHLA